MSRKKPSDSANPAAPGMPTETPAPAAMPGEAEPVEIELKLLVEPGDMATFEAAPIIIEHATSRGTRRRLEATYYDTASRALRREGLTLRVRRSGARHIGARYVQTVKSNLPQDPLRRGEWEAPVPGPEPDLPLAMPLLPAELARRLADDPLLPVFATDVRRLTRSLTLPTGRIEMAFDTGSIVAGERRLPVAEIELELKDGSPALLYEIGLRLLEQGPARPSVRAKSDRGFDLADDIAPSPPRPRRAPIDRKASLDDALLGILRALLVHLFAAIPAAEDGHTPEGVHQTRVSLRRLRSLLGLLRGLGRGKATERLRAETRWLADALGPARELDVFIGQTLTGIANALPGLEGFDALRGSALSARDIHYGEVQALLRDTRTSRFLLELGAWIEGRGWREEAGRAAVAALDGPAADFAQKTLETMHAKVIKRGRHFKLMNPDARHELRLAVKKLRYATDFLGPMLGDGKGMRAYFAALAELQDQLGLYNDMATTRDLMVRLRDAPGGQSVAAGAIAGWQARGMIAADVQLAAAWKTFHDLNPPRRRKD